MRCLKRKSKAHHSPLPVLQPQYDGWDPFTTNAAPLLLPNGSAVLVYRGFNVSGTDAIGLAFSKDGPSGPFERISKDKPIFTDHDEDPYIYKVRAARPALTRSPYSDRSDPSAPPGAGTEEHP